MASKATISAADAERLGIGKAQRSSKGSSRGRPAKMEPMGATQDITRIKQNEREIKALWTAYSELLCDFNKLKVSERSDD